METPYNQYSRKNDNIQFEGLFFRDIVKIANIKEMNVNESICITTRKYRENIGN